MDQGIRIREGRREDAEVIASFNRAMAQETESRDLPAAVALAGVRGLFERPGVGFYLLAEVDGDVVGSLMVTPEWSDWRNGFFWWVQSVYVRPQARRRGVYRALYDHVKTLAAGEPDVCGFRLYVERENAGARRVYEALGMRSTPYRLYEEPGPRSG